MTGCNILCWIGAAAIAFVAVKLLAYLHQYFIAKSNLNKYKKVGAWAVVTGASDGIGKAMSQELAKRGFNVCLISRTKSKLDEVAAELTAKGVQARTIAFDFSKAEEAEYNKLFKELDQIPIGILVNNVGINYDYPMNIDEADVSLDMSLIKVNIESQLRMTKYVVPRMKEKKGGAILNLSSLSCRVRTAMLATYAATKSFNKTFSEALTVELKPFGIDVTCVSPGFVCSNMTKRTRPAFDCPSASSMVKQTLDQLGTTAITWGHVNHSILGSVIESAPHFFMDGKVLSINKAVRSKALKKKEAAKA